MRFLNTPPTEAVIPNESEVNAMDSSQTMILGDLAVIGLGERRAAEQRFADLVHRQSRFVFRVAFSVLRNAPDAEEVVQDLFVKLHRSGAWSTMEDEAAFLARSTWRLAVDRLPRRRSMSAVPPETAAPAPSTEQAAIDAEQVARVHRLIDALPDELRQPLLLSAIDELNSRQIGEVLEIPEGTVRTRIMRARQILKEKLAVRPGGRP